MGADEVGTLAALKAIRRDVVDPAIGDHKGRIVKTTGDGLLVEFASAVDAVNCAMTVQGLMAERAKDGSKITFRIGINIGDIIIDGDDIFGDGVNIAARVESECKPGEVCLSSSAFEQVRSKTSFAFEDLGERSLKNIDRPVRLYAARPALATPHPDRERVELAKPLPLPDKPSIAVLPFQNMSGDPEQEYFADGMVEDIITALSRFKSLFVIARNTSFIYKGKSVNINQIGRDLGVRYVLEGSVRKAAGKLRITGQLIEAATNNHLWAEKFDGKVEDIFELQDKVVGNVVSSIAPMLELAEIERANQKPTEKLECYDFYLRGLSKHRSLQSGREARELFEKAIEKDRNFGPAYAMIAWGILMEQSTTGRPLRPEKLAQSLQFARIAAQLAPEDAFSLARSGHVLTYLGHEFDLGASMIEEALIRNPNLAAAWYSQGWVTMMCGDAAKAVESFDTMLRLSPLDPLRGSVWNGRAFALFLLGRYGEGRASAERTKQFYTDIHTLSPIALNCVGLGQLDEARDIVQQILKLSSQFSIARAMQAFPTRSKEYSRVIAAAFEQAGLPAG
ncbi:MAG: tetratricopeptide repeat protein [Bradyrhizobium sp.]|nr:tetratricopeptide repeat protein [Bradyrhizobium sp.]